MTTGDPGRPDYIVIRPAADLPDGWLPVELDGKWVDRTSLPTRDQIQGSPAVQFGTAVAVPSGRFEIREHDGAIAEVYEIRP